MNCAANILLLSGIRYRKGMRKLVWLWFVLGIGVGAQAQVLETPYKAKTLVPTYDTIHIDSVSINASFFKVLDHNGEPIDPDAYEINFPESYLVFKKISISLRFDTHSLPQIPGTSHQKIQHLRRCPRAHHQHSAAEIV